MVARLLIKAGKWVGEHKLIVFSLLLNAALLVFLVLTAVEDDKRMLDLGRRHAETMGRILAEQNCTEVGGVDEVCENLTVAVSDTMYQRRTAWIVSAHSDNWDDYWASMILDGNLNPVEFNLHSPSR